MLRPSSRGGVPVFRRPSAKPSFSSVRERPKRRRFADAAGGNLLFADMDEAAQKRPGGQNHGAARELAAVGEFDAADAPIRDDQVVRFRFDHLQIRRFANRGLHRRRVELAIGLGAGAAYRRAFAAIQNTKLDAATVGDAAHKAVQSVDFPDQMTLAEAANRRIAGHGADGGEAMRHQRRLRAHAGGRGRGLTAGMAAADHNDVESGLHGRLECGPCSGGRLRGQKEQIRQKMFHVKHRERPEKSVFHVKHWGESGNKLPHFWRFLGLEHPKQRL